MSDVIKLLATSQTISTNTALSNARLVRVTNISANLALVTLSDPIANVVVGTCYLPGGRIVAIQKAAKETLSSNSASGMVGVAVAYGN